jgi:hypothetical protein
MARSNTDEADSDFYPPRARWYSPVFHLWFELRRLFHLEKVRLPMGFTSAQVVLSLVIPGFSLVANGRRLLGWSMLGLFCLSGLVAVVALGYPIGGLAYGLMIAAHATSIVFLETCWIRDSCQFGYRLALSGLTLLVVWLGVYAQGRGYVERHWLMPMRVRGQVVIVQRAVPPGDVRRGDAILYRMGEGYSGDGHRGGAVQVRAGFGWGPVLAVAGDRVDFSTNSYAVNGVAHPPLPHMPREGGLVVPEKQWFIWPEFDISGPGNVGEASLAGMLLQMATVSENRFIGKPFKHWFWRRQISP